VRESILTEEVGQETETEKLVVHFKYSTPLELNEFASAMAALGDNFKHNLESDPLRYPYEGSLYIKEIRPGSIIVDLFSYAPIVLASAEHVGTVITYASKLKGMVEYFLDKRKPKPPITRADCLQVAEVMKPIARDEAAQINVNVVNTGNGTVINHIHLDSRGAQKVIRSAMNEKNILEQPVPAEFKSVVLRFYQARNKTKTKTGDRGIIENISKSHVKLQFVNDKAKDKIIKEKGNPFQRLYLVDVRVDKVENRPVLYKIMAVHNSWPIQG